MRRALTLSAACLFCAAAFLVSGTTTAREWTDASSNKTIEADLVQQLGDKVVLRLATDGKLYTVPVNRLSAADQAFLKTAGGKPAGGSVLDKYIAKSREVVVDTSGSDRWSTAIRSDPNNPTNYVRRGMARVAKGDYEAGIKDYAKAISLDPKNADAYNGRGRAYAKAGEPVKAHNDFNRAIDLDGKLASAYRYRADNMKALAETETGKEMLEEAKTKLKKKWEAMARDNDKVSPWQPLNSTKGPMTANELAIGLANRDYKYAEMLAWDSDYGLGLVGGGGGAGAGAGVGVGVGAGTGVAVGPAVVGGQQPLVVYPEAVVKGTPVTLIADQRAMQIGMPQKIGANGRPMMSGGKIKAPLKEGVEAVDFYRDSDGDGNLQVESDQYLGSDTDARDGFSIEAPTNSFALGENVFYAVPRGAEGTDRKAGPDLASVADRLERAAQEERTIAAEAAQAGPTGLEGEGAKPLRDDQRGVQSTARSVMRDVKNSAPEAYDQLKEVSRGSLTVDKALAAADPEAASTAAIANAERLEEIARTLKELSSTQSTAAKGVPAYAPGRILPPKQGGGEKGVVGGGGGGKGNGGNGGGGYAKRAERAVEYIDRGDYDRAVVEYDRLIDEEPDNEYYLRQRAGAQLARGGYDYAIRDFDRLVEFDKKNADLYYNRGCAHLAAGNIKEAVADFDISISLDETRNLAYTNRGVAHARVGEYVKAIADFDRAISLNATDALAYRNRALAYHKLGRLQDAQADLERLEKLTEITVIK